MAAPAFLPFQAQYHSASHKRYEECIVFVHQFGGNAGSLARHIEFVNELGFDAVSFDLIFCELNPKRPLPITASLKIGARFVWTEQIEAVLNSLPGKKILYSFSMPSNSALSALAHRRAEDVVSWVCDGGPFLQLTTCIAHLFEHQYHVTSRILRAGYTATALLFYGLGFEKEVPSLLRSLPKGFAIFSIRGLSDPLVAPEAIDEVFSHGKNLHLETLSLADGKHLDGLKNFSEEYTVNVSRFLKATAHPVRATQVR